MQFKLGQKIIDKIRGKKEKISPPPFYCYDIEWLQRLNCEIKDIDILNEYRKLMRNLDEESALIVSRILHRVMNIQKKPFLYLDELKKVKLPESLFTHPPQKSMRIVGITIDISYQFQDLTLMFFLIIYFSMNSQI